MTAHYITFRVGDKVKLRDNLTKIQRDMLYCAWCISSDRVYEILGIYKSPLFNDRPRDAMVIDFAIRNDGHITLTNIGASWFELAEDRVGFMIE